MKSNYEKMYIDSSWISPEGMELHFKDTDSFIFDAGEVLDGKPIPLFYRLSEQQPVLFFKTEEEKDFKSFRLCWSKEEKQTNYYMLKGILWGKDISFELKNQPNSNTVLGKVFYDETVCEAYRFVDSKIVEVTDHRYEKNDLQGGLCPFTCQEGIISLKTVPSDILGEEQLPVITHRYFMYPHSLNLIDTVRGGVLCTYYDKDMM